MKLARPRPPAPAEDDAAGAALIKLGVSMLVGLLLPDDVRARYLEAVRAELRRPPAAPPGDLSAQHPEAIDV